MSLATVRTCALAAMIPHLSAHDLSEIDAEIRAVLAEIGRDTDVLRKC